MAQPETTRDDDFVALMQTPIPRLRLYQGGIGNTRNLAEDYFIIQGIGGPEALPTMADNGGYDPVCLQWCW
jgi:hypothetical protein